MKRIVYLIVFSGIITTMSCLVTTNNGEHTGFVTAIEDRGFIFKTTEVYVKSSPESTQEETYCLESINKSLINKLRIHSIDQTKMTLEYSCEAFTAPWRCRSNCYITNVK